MPPDRLAESRIVTNGTTEPSVADRHKLNETQRFLVQDYFEDNASELRDQLTDYNKRFRLSVPEDGHDVAVRRINSFVIEAVEGERVRVRVSFDVGASRGGSQQIETYSFAMKWSGDRLYLLSHSAD